MKKIIALTLATLMLLPLLFSCSSSKKNKAPEKEVLEHVYLTTEYPLPKDVRGSSMIQSGDNIFLFANVEKKMKDEQGYEYYESGVKIFVNDTSFSQWKEIMSFEELYKWDDEAQESENNRPQLIRPDGQGGFLLLMNSSYENWSDPENYIFEQSWEVQKVDSVGNVLSAVKLELDTEDGIYIYVSEVSLLDDGNYLVLSDLNAYVVSPDGKILRTCNMVENISTVSSWGNGKLAVSYFDENWNTCLGVYDATTDKFEELGSFGVNKGGMSPLTTEDGRLYMVDNNGLIEYDPVTLKEKGVVIDWFNSDINPNYVWGLTKIGDDFYNVDQSDWENPVLMKLTPCDEVIEKYVIDLACLYLDYTMVESVLDFNRSNEEYRVRVKTYGEYDYEADRDVGIEKLENELIKGNIPDIIDLSGLDYKKYAAKGMLSDLYPLIDSDTEISRDEFLSGILEAGEVDGKLYSLISNFSVSTLMGKTAVVGDRNSWTWRELNETLAKYPGAVAFTQMEREQLLRNILSVTLYDYIDYSDGTTRFDSAEFQELLKFCAPYPETIDWDTYYEDYDWEVEQSLYRENGILLVDRYFSSPWDFMCENNPFEAEVTMIGYPTSSGSGSVIEPQSEWGISKNCHFKEQAFAFLKKVIYEHEDYSFSSLEAKLDESFKKAVEDSKNQGGIITDEVIVKPMYAEENEVMIPVDVESDEDVSVDVDTDIDGDDASTGEDIILPEKPVVTLEFDDEKARESAEFIKSVSRRRAPREHEVINIVIEESAAFFAGQKSVEETCRIINSRAFVYVSENM